MKSIIPILIIFCISNAYSTNIIFENSTKDDVKIKYFYNFRDYCYNLEEFNYLSIPKKSKKVITIDTNQLELYVSHNEDCHYPQTILLLKNEIINVEITNTEFAVNDIKVKYQDSLSINSLKKFYFRQDSIYQHLVYYQESFEDFKKEYNSKLNNELQELENILLHSEYENFSEYYKDVIKFKYNYIIVDNILRNIILEDKKDLIDIELSTSVDTNVINNSKFKNSRFYSSFMSRYAYFKGQIAISVLEKKYGRKIFQPNFLEENIDEFFDLLNYGLQEEAKKDFLYFLFLDKIEEKVDLSLCEKIDKYHSGDKKRRLELACKKVNYYNNMKNLPYNQFDLIDGSVYSFDELKDKAVLIAFWSKGCYPCIENIPKIEKIAKKLRKQDFKVLYVSVDNEEDYERRKHLVNYEYFVDICVGGGWISKYLKSIGTNSLPHYILLDKNHQIVELDFEPHNVSRTVRLIKEVLEQ